MKKGVLSVVFASAMLGATSMAFAGAYGEPEQPEELPVPAPAAAPAPEPEPVVPVRKFIGFITDAETTRGLRAEIGTMYAAEYHPSSVGNAEATNTYAHISYGKELWEVGALLPPFQYVHQNGIGDTTDFGDLRLWGKIIPLRTENFSAGGGMQITFPTAGSGLGTEGYGFKPFLTAGGLAGPVHLRGSVGYDVYADSNDAIADDAFDNVDLNFAALYPVCENTVIRTELTWNHFADSGADPVSIFPGVDYSIPVGSNELVLRPTLGIGLTEAPDWQIGLGIALNLPGI